MYGVGRPSREISEDDCVGSLRREQLGHQRSPAVFVAMRREFASGDVTAYRMQLQTKTPARDTYCKVAAFSQPGDTAAYLQSIGGELSHHEPRN